MRARRSQDKHLSITLTVFPSSQHFASKRTSHLVYPLARIVPGSNIFCDACFVRRTITQQFLDKALSCCQEPCHPQSDKFERLSETNVRVALKFVPV